MSRDRTPSPTSPRVISASPTESVGTEGDIVMALPPLLPRRLDFDDVSDSDREDGEDTGSVVSRNDEAPFTINRLNEVLAAFSPDNDDSGSFNSINASPLANIDGLSPIAHAEHDDDSLSVSTNNTETEPTEVTWVARVGRIARAGTPKETEETKEESAPARRLFTDLLSEETKTSSPERPLLTR